MQSFVKKKKKVFKKEKKRRGRFTYKPSAMHSSSSSSPFTSCVSDLTPEGIRRLGFLSRIELAFANGVETLFLRLVFQTRQCMGLTLGLLTYNAMFGSTYHTLI
jgi:hypothetical protein